MILISAFAILSPQPANTSLTQFRYQHPCLAGPCDPGSPCPVLSLSLFGGQADSQDRMDQIMRVAGGR